MDEARVSKNFKWWFCKTFKRDFADNSLKDKNKIPVDGENIITEVNETSWNG